MIIASINSCNTLCLNVAVLRTSTVVAVAPGGAACPDKVPNCPAYLSSRALKAESCPRNIWGSKYWLPEIWRHRAQDYLVSHFLFIDRYRLHESPTSHIHGGLDKSESRIIYLTKSHWALSQCLCHCWGCGEACTLRTLLPSAFSKDNCNHQGGRTDNTNTAPPVFQASFPPSARGGGHEQTSQAWRIIGKKRQLTNLEAQGKYRIKDAKTQEGMEAKSSRQWSWTTWLQNIAALAGLAALLITGFFAVRMYMLAMWTARKDAVGFCSNLEQQVCDLYRSQLCD